VPAFPIVTSTIGVHVEAVAPNLSIAESAIPILFEGALLEQEVPHWGPEDFYFKVWRPPLENVALKNDTLSLGLQSYFYLAVGDPYDPFIQCGFRHERALHRSIAMESKLGWGKNWQVQTTTTATLGDPDTKCVLSFIHYDATHLLDDNLGKALQAGAKGLDEAIGKQTNQLSNARLFWDNTKATRQLSPGVWLQLRPKNVNAGSVHSVPTTDANIYRLSSDFALTAEPQLTYGERPKDDTTALPDLSVFTPTSQNIDLYPELRLSTTNATKLLASKFPITINYGRHQLELTDPIVQISGGKLVVTLQIRSGVNRLKGRNKPIISPIRNVYMKMVYAILERKWDDEGQIAPVGTPSFDDGTRDIYSSDLDFDLQTRNALLKAVEWIFHTPAVAILRTEARWNFGTDADLLRKALDTQLNKTLTESVSMNGYVEDLKGDLIYTQRDNGVDYVTARVHVSGNANIVLH
jgi:hypothetical protein